ncbi:MAG: methyltransferase domain-containing protein [Clostridiaceae bacterium]|nr:methyltransferase domain-containing protein [Clostridiaceae bacterium]
MSKQNIYDNEIFFNGYCSLRENDDSANNLEEKPAIFSMLGDVKGKSVIDLGCGYGENCKAFSEMGAERIVGIDISRKMLELAKKENCAQNIHYLNMPMENIRSLDDKFDIAVSSLALHYIRGYDELIYDVFSLLKPGGIFLFSQEHPLTTAPVDGAKWIKNEDGSVDHYRLADYARAGERKVTWFVDDVVKYHRTFSQLINGLVRSGFVILEMEEPVASQETIQRLPQYGKDLHKPNFLMIKAKKLSSV